LRGFLAGLSGDLRGHLNAAADGAGTVLNVQRAGRSVSVRLSSIPFASENLRQWIDAGSVRVGDLHLPPGIAWAVREGGATENGPVEAELVLSRSGSVEKASVVRLSIGGSAINGEDIASLPVTLTIPPGERTASLMVRPFVDSRAEPQESVEITVLNSDDYLVTGPATATVTIADLLPVITIEALEPVATLQPLAPASVLIRREALVDRSVLVRMEIRGSASAGTDYATLSRFVNLTPGQTTALISVIPQAGALLEGGAETVEFVVAEDPEYLIGPQRAARVTLVKETSTFAAWRQQHFPSHDGPLEAFGAADSGGTGVSHLLRYAFGMDPAHPDRARLPKIVVRDGHLTVDISRRPGATDVEVIAEVSTQLGNWQSGAGRIEQVYPAELAGNAGMICLRALPPLAETPSLFVNIRVVLRP
jgi:hypothetical protein